MYYMIAFNKPENVILYWDEPTITMDCFDHPIHNVIQNNWRENLIPNVILSSATLPKEYELHDVITDYKCKFENAEIYTITSHDCIKSITLLNKEGYVELPHYLSNDYKQIKKSIEHCKKYYTLL